MSINVYVHRVIDNVFYNFFLSAYSIFKLKKENYESNISNKIYKQVNQLL